MLHRSFQRPAINAQMLNFAITFKLCKNPSSYKANFNSCFPSPTQYKQKAATAEYSKEPQNLKKATALL